MDRQFFLDNLGEQIRCKRAVPYIKKELDDHIEDQKDAFMANGMDAKEAEVAAVQEMGDPVEIGVMLDRVHRPKMEWKVVVLVILLSIIGLLVQGTILAVGGGDNAIIEFVSNEAVFRKHIITMAAGIGLMFLICYLDYSILNKTSIPFWILLNILMFLSSIVQVNGFTQFVNGMNRYGVYALYMSIPIYAAVVYHFRKEKEKGLIKSIGCLLIFIAMAACSVSLTIVGFFYVINLFVLFSAIWKGWFGNDRKRTCGIFAGVALVPLAAVFVYCIINFSEYYRARAAIYLDIGGTRVSYENYILNLMTQYIHGGSTVDEAVSQNIQMLQETIRNDYVWRFIFEYCGIFVGLLLATVFAALIVMLIRMTQGQKNQLGYIISVGCVLFLLLETVFYIGGNFAVTPYAGSYMPFFSNGVVVNMVTYVYMGLLLSIYRNTNVVRN